MDTARKCDGQCQNCTLIQQTYCSAVRLHAFMEHEQDLFARLQRIEQAIDEIDRRMKPDSIIAQGGDGAVKVAESTI